MTSSFNNSSSEQNAETLGTAFNAAIQPKMSNTTEVEPAPEELIVGELAVNTADGKLFVKHTDGTIKSISGGGGGGAALASWSVTDNSAQPVPPILDDWYYYISDPDTATWDGTGSRITTWYSNSGIGVLESVDLKGRDITANPLWMAVNEDYPNGKTDQAWLSLDGGVTWVERGLSFQGGLYDFDTQTTLPGTSAWGLLVSSPDFPEEWEGIGLNDKGVSAILTLVDPATSEPAPVLSYKLQGPGLPAGGFVGTLNPDLYLYRGQFCNFSNLTGAHPFQIQSTPGIGGTVYSEGITNNGVTDGILEWDVAMDSPDVLYYQCQVHATMGGKIYILDEPDTTTINVYDDIVEPNDMSRYWRFNVVPFISGVLTTGGEASCHFAGFPADSDNVYAAFSDNDADGKPWITDPIFDEIDDPPQPGTYTFWFSLDNGLTWTYQGPMYPYPPLGTGLGKTFGNPSYPITPDWNTSSEVLVYIGATKNAPGPKVAVDRDVLVYNETLSAYAPGQLSVSDLSDFSLVDGPVTSFTYDATFVGVSGTVNDGQMKIVNFSPTSNGYKVRFDYSYSGSCCSNNTSKVGDASDAWLALTGSRAGQPFWLTNEDTGVTTGHFGEYDSLGGGQLEFTDITGDPLPSGVPNPAKFTLSVTTDPTLKIQPAQADRIAWNDTDKRWEPMPATSVNGQTGTVSLATSNLTDVALAPFSNFYYYTSVADGGTVEGDTNARLSTAVQFGNQYLVFDILDQNGRDITADPAWPLNHDASLNAEYQDLYVSTDGGVSWHYNRYYSYGGAPGADNSAGTRFLDGTFLDVVSPPYYPPNCDVDGSDVIVALLDPRLGALPATGEALVATSVDAVTSTYSPTKIVTMGQLKVETALATDFADFQARIAAL